MAINTFQELGSVDDFAKARELDPNDPVTLELFTTALGGLRKAAGITGYRDSVAPGSDNPEISAQGGSES